MSTVSNIRVTSASQFSVLTPEKGELAVKELHKLLSDTPLTKSIYVEIDGAEIDGLGAVENYTFIVVRRFKVNGVLHIGGQNGEILNTEDFFEAVYQAAQA